MGISLHELPSLDAVKGFVAVGRRMSVSLAAGDLCITQSAMSKQIRNLEQSLGVRLFQRNWRSVAFTSEGERLFCALSTCIEQLQDGFESIGFGSRRPVTISTSIGVSGLWLLPRINDFQKTHPDIELRISANNAVMDLSSEGVDLAIRYSTSAKAPAGALRLFGETIAPVASPKLRVDRLDSAREIGRHVLLDFDDKHEWLTWSGWLAERGLTTSMARGVLRFNQYDQAIQAAAAGQGVALGRLELVEALLRDGRLEVPETVVPSRSGHSYWLLQASSCPRVDVRRVQDWVLKSQHDVPAGAERARQ